MMHKYTYHYRPVNSADTLWDPSVRHYVWRRRPGLVGALHDVGPFEALDGQKLRHLCQESPEVDWTWG